MADNASDKPDPQETGASSFEEEVMRNRVLLNDNPDEAPPGFAAQVQRTLSSGWHKAKVSLLAQLPVIGPHGTGVTEAELLLNGKKPMGWIPVVPDNVDPFVPDTRSMIAMEAKLDQAVKEGRLKSIDVVVREPSQNGGPAWESIFRHYCQPGNEKDMETVAAYNEKIWNRQTPDAQLQKSFGDYLGYRKRDQMLFDGLQRYRAYLPNSLVGAIYDVNRNYTQPAYLEQMLGHPVEKGATAFEAALSGDAAAQFRMGQIFRYGQEGAPRDNVKAMEWYTRAAEGGLAVAQAEVGRHYAAGDIVPQDGAAAAKWLKLAVDQGHPGAMTSLGLLYEQGEGIERNDGKAMELFRRAAELGDSGAHSVLGSHYATGRGVPQDNVEAGFWYKLASRPNFPPPGGDILSKLTPEQTAAVEGRVAEWEAGHGTPKALFKAQLEAGTASAELPMKPRVPVSLPPGKNPPAPMVDPYQGTILSRESREILKTAAGIARSKDAQDMLMRNTESLLGSLDPVGKLRLVSALATLSKTPEGKHLVEQLEDSGAQVKLAVSPADGGGLFIPEIRVSSDGSVVTYPHAVTAPGATSQESLLIVLTHELKHLNQAQTRNLSPFASGKLPGPDDIILRNRFIEADADATVVEIAFKLKQQGSPEMWNGLTAGGFRHPMAMAFENAVKADPAALDNGHAKRAAFDTWFTAERSPGYRIADHYNEVGLQFWPEKGFARDMLESGARTEPLAEEDYKRLGQQKPGVNYLDLPGARPLNDPYYSAANFTPGQQQMLERQRAAYEHLKNLTAAGPAPDPESAGEKMRPAPLVVPKTQDSVPRDAPRSAAQQLADLYIKAVAMGKSLPENIKIAADTPSALVTALPYVQKMRRDRALKTLASVPEGATLIEAARTENMPITLNPHPLARDSAVHTETLGPEKNFRTVAQSISLQGYSTEGALIAHMAHELQHLRQINAGLWSNRSGLRTPEEQIRYERFLEADAEATATEVAFKLKQAGKPAAWNALQSSFSMTTEISTAYEKMAAEDPVAVTDGRAKRAAFDTWFEAKGKNGKPLTNYYNIQAMNNYPPEFRLAQLADKDGIPEFMTPEDVKRLGTLSAVNYLDIPGGKPLDDLSYSDPKFTGAAAKKYRALSDTFNKFVRRAQTRTQMVTLQHGTSEANLKTILEDGFQPRYRGARDKVRDVLKGAMPQGSDLESKVTELVEKNSTIRHRAHEIGDLIYTTSDTQRATEYAVREGQSGGEIASKIYAAAGIKASQREFSDARPVRLEIEAPSDGIVRKGDETLRKIPGGGMTVDSAHEVLVKASESVRVKSITFARLEDGLWTFDGQPALTPEEALKQIQPRYAAPRTSAPPDAARQAILKDINDFATGPAVKVTMNEATYVAETVVTSPNGFEELVRVPDPRFVPMAEEKLGYFKGATAHYVMPYDLTPIELNAYVTTLNVEAERGKITPAEKTAKMNGLLAEMERVNPELKDVAFDRASPEKVAGAVHGVLNQIKPQDIQYHLSGGPRPANYESMRGQTAGMDWDFTPETMQNVNRQMEEKNKAFALQEQERQMSAQKVAAAEGELDAVLKRNAEKPAQPPFDPLQRNYWRHSTGDVVTLEHGTSEGALYSILTDGFKPFSGDVAANTKEIVRDLLPGQPVTDEFVAKIMQGSHAGFRALQSENGRSLFALPGPNSENATRYAINNARNGGEFANNIHQQVQDFAGGGVPPRYPGARPVMLVFDVPRSDLGSKLPDKALYAEMTGQGLPLDYLAESEVAVNTTKNIRNVSAIFAAKDESGNWTFKGQPVLSREQALAEIQPRLQPAVSPARAQELFDMLKNNSSVPHTASQWCGKRAEVMQGLMLQEGVPVGAIGTAYIQAAPGAPASEQMHVEPPPGVEKFSFAQLLKPGQDRIEYNGFEFRRTDLPDGSPGLIINHADGSRVQAPNENWHARLGDTGGTVATYGDHVTPSVRVRTPEGVVNMVLDPSVAEGPVTFREWHAKLGGPAAIAVNADWHGGMRPEVTTPESAQRLAKILGTTVDAPALETAIDKAVANPEAYRNLIEGAYGKGFVGNDVRPTLPLPYLDAGGKPLTGEALNVKVRQGAEILKPFVAWTEFRDQHYSGADVKVAPAPVKPVPPAAGEGAGSKFLQGKTNVAPDVRKAGIGGAGVGAVGLVMSVQGLDQAIRSHDKVEMGIAGVNLATSTMQTTEGILSAAGKTLPVIKGAAKFVPGANIAVTVADGVYQMSKEDTVRHKTERGVVVGVTAATGIGLGMATASVAEAGVITTGVTAIFGTGAIATGAAAIAVAAAPVVLTVAAVGTVAYAGNKALEAKRAWDAVDDSIAEQSKPVKREGYKTGDGKPSILQYKHIAVEMLRVSGDMKDENMNGKPARDKNGRILIDEIRKIDMHDPKNVAELERALDLNIKKQQEIMKANDSLIVPRWMRSSASADKYTMAQMELGDLTGARAELDMYRKDLQAYDSAHPDAPVTTPSAAAPVRKQGPKLSS